MQPLHYDLRCPAAKDTSIMHPAVAPSNLDAALTLRSADTELQNTIELRATALEIAAPKPDLDAKGKKNKILKHFLRRGPAAKDNSITHAAVAPSNLDAALTLRSADTELQNTIELRATALEIAAPKPDLNAKRKKHDFEALFEKSFEGKSSAPK